MKTIGIVGSRRRNTPVDFFLVYGAFERIAEIDDRIVSGGCPEGGDSFAERIAKQRQHTITIHYAKWRKMPKTAGFHRNGLIAEDADVLIACVAGDRAGGTEDTIEKFALKCRVHGWDVKERLILV